MIRLVRGLMMKKALVLVSDAVSIKNPYLIKTIKKLVNNQIRVTVLVMILDYHLAAKVTFKLTKAVARENSEAKIINWFDLLHEQKGIAVSLQTLDTIHSGEPEKRTFELPEHEKIERYFDKHDLIMERIFRQDRLALLKSFADGTLQTQYYYDDQQRVREVVHFQDGQPTIYEVLNNTNQQLYQFIVKQPRLRNYRVASDSEFAARGAIVESDLFKGTPRNTVRFEISNSQFSVHDYVTWRPYKNVFEFYAGQLRQLIDNDQTTGIFIDLELVESMSPYLGTLKTFNY